MNNAQAQTKIALVTLSYAPDFERCKLLIQSVERCLTSNVHHYVVVDKRDVSLFQPMVSSRVSLRVVEDLLPSWIFRVSGINNWWISLRSLPVRNWIVQQLVKMSIFNGIDEKVAVFCDSDNAFIRPSNLESIFLKGDDLALLRVDFKSKDIYRWIQSSCRLLGLNPSRVLPANYISNLIAWRQENVEAMQRHIEDVTGVHWVKAVCQQRTISEYMLYGIFVEYVLNLKAAKHFLFDTELMKPSWSRRLVTQEEVDNFFDEIRGHHIGVMIHSKDNVPVEQYRGRIRAFWQ